MSNANVDLVRESYERWLAGEPESPLGRQHGTNFGRQLKMIPQRFRAEGARVLVDLKQTWTDDESGEPREVHYFALWTIRAGAPPSYETFGNEVDAVEALHVPTDKG